MSVNKLAVDMTPEQQLAHFVAGLSIDQIPDSARKTVRLMVLTNAGTAIAGASQDGIEELRALLMEAGGRPQATLLVYGDKLPAVAAAQFNATMCRALDFCDAMAPGPHFGAALIPVAMAAAELRGGCSGNDFVAAIAAGVELGARLNLSESQYDGFDPTGVIVVLAAAATASRMLQLTPAQTLNALGLAMNRCGGSFQSHVDGSLAVRIVQGWVAQAGLQCAQMALRNISGPENFLTGHYGYAHLYGRNRLDIGACLDQLGKQWQLQSVMFKPYPSCGATQGLTRLLLNLITDKHIDAQHVDMVEIRLPPYSHKLVGHPFSVGPNLRVDAQFCAAWCAANALVRREVRLAHFEPDAVTDAQILAVARRVVVLPDADLTARGHSAVDVTVTMQDGSRFQRGLDTAPGFPDAPLTDDEHCARYEDCLSYAPYPMAESSESRLPEIIEYLEHMSDIRELISVLVRAEGLGGQRFEA
ncbi:MAG: MmgE/PrpD family protein [Burkholderiaceae bacterium]